MCRYRTALFLTGFHLCLKVIMTEKNTEYGKELNPYRKSSKVNGIKGARRTVRYTHTPSHINQGETLTVTFPRMGKYDMIVPGTSRLTPHVTREKAVSCQITFKLYRFFSQFVANSSKASLSCYIYCDLWQLMVILRIVYVIYCDFAIVCDIYCDLWQICNNFKL